MSKVRFQILKAVIYNVCIIIYMINIETLIGSSMALDPTLHILDGEWHQSWDPYYPFFSVSILFYY
jgi:hypothetical protein